MAYFRSEEHRKKMSEMAKQRYIDKPELRLIISKTHKGKKKNYLICQSPEIRIKRSNGWHKSFNEGKIKLRYGKDSWSWKGGRVKTKDGYIKAYCPNHPNGQKGSSTQGYVLEHRLVMEKNLGRYLNQDEAVHHINGIKDDNRIENLILYKKKEHLDYHRKKRIIRKWINQESLS